jgi:hypothetical protein
VHIRCAVKCIREEEAANRSIIVSETGDSYGGLVVTIPVQPGVVIVREITDVAVSASRRKRVTVA